MTIKRTLEFLALGGMLFGALEGCAPAPAASAAPVAGAVAAAPAANSVTQLQAFTVADLTAALADATAAKDTVAATCWAALIPVVQAQGATLGVLPVGAVSAFQKARDVGVGIKVGLPALNVPCAPLVLDTQNTLLRLGALTGAGIIAGPLVPLLP
jgi:hypothetical protein